jgi:hypothetical protein
MPLVIRRPALPLLLLATLAVACDDGPTAPGPVTPRPPRGIVVMDGFVQPGLTLIPDTGTAVSRIPFGPPTEFDAGSFTLDRDTVLATSSRGAGDLLYVAALAGGTVRRIALPPRSNPSAARFGASGSTVLVALRDSSAVATVDLRGGTPTVTLVRNAGTCPTDAAIVAGALWIADANATCRTNYRSLGDMRLIRAADPAGAARDTIVLPGLRGSNASLTIVGEEAWVAAGGVADFGVTPFALLSSGAIARVDLRTRRVVTILSMPSGTWGAGMRLGGDGRLYVSTFENLTTFRSRIVAVDRLAMAFTGPQAAGQAYLALLRSDGSAATCGGATADALGRVVCYENGTASATTVRVFDPAGREVRAVAAGQGGVAIAVRP